MPGSWEMSPTVMSFFLHTETTSIAWALGLRRLILPGPDPVPIAGMPFDHARNEACRIVLGQNADYLFFLDSDVIPPRDAVLRLLAHKQPIISGMYCRRSPPWSVPVMMRNGQWVTKFKVGSVQDVELVGAGCLLIHRDVLTSLPPIRPGHHWFDWRVNYRGLGVVPDNECLSEDYSFCLHARKHGYKILVDTSVRCRHAGYAEAELFSFKPLDAGAAA